MINNSIVCVTVGGESFTGANEDHIIGFFCCLDSMDSDLRVADILL